MLSSPVTPVLTRLDGDAGTSSPLPLDSLSTRFRLGLRTPLVAITHTLRTDARRVKPRNGETLERLLGKQPVLPRQRSALNVTVTSAVATATVPYSGHRRLKPSTNAAAWAESTPERAKSRCTVFSVVRSVR